MKILFNKKDNALVQMADPHQAQLGKYICRLSCLLLTSRYCSPGGAICGLSYHNKHLVTLLLDDKPLLNWTVFGHLSY